MKTQRLKIKKWLQDGNKITSLEAERMWGCRRLAARIGELKKEGLQITSSMVERVNRFGEAVRVAQYSL